MPCSSIKVGGITAIVCGRAKIHACSVCGEPSTRQCDWKIDSYHTCDKHLCEKCTHVPAPNKDLCPRHAQRWAEIQKQRDLPL